MIDPESIPRLMAAGTIEVAPLAFMRGRTLNDSFVILDEAQNTTAEQMKMFLTRLGFGSKMVVTGDVTQVDLPGGTPSGLRVVREILDEHRRRALRHLTSRRRPPPLVGEIVDAYARWDADPAAAPAGNGRARGSPADAEREADRMPVEVANESGIDVDEVALAGICPFRPRRDEGQPAGRAVGAVVDDEAMSELHDR